MSGMYRWGRDAHAYQHRGMWQIVEQPRVAMLWEMGLGKTATTLHAIQYMIDVARTVHKVLVVAPARVAASTWSAEAARWHDTAYLKVIPLVGAPNARKGLLRASGDVYTISQELLPWLVTEYGGRVWPWDMVVLDELSGYKAWGSKRVKAARKACHAARRVVGLTGTPTPRDCLDLYAQVYLLDEGARLGRTLTEFRQTYATPHPGVDHVWLPRPDALQRIEAVIRDIAHSLLTDDEIELPERVDAVVPVELPPGAEDMYHTARRERVIELAGRVEAIDSAAQLSNIQRQICQGYVYDASHKPHRVHTAKRDALIELLRGLDGASALVYYTYRHDIPSIIEACAAVGADWMRLEGGESIRAWCAGELDVLIAPPSAGYGLNLQGGGHHVVWYGLPWSLADYQQSCDRLHRQGQRHPVVVHHLVAQGHIDERVMSVLADKGAGQAHLMAALTADWQGGMQHE